MTVNAYSYIINKYSRIALLCRHLSKFISGVNVLVTAFMRSLAQELGEQGSATSLNPAAALACLGAACDGHAGTVQNLD